ncbi:hypothetical protein JCM3770_003857, partial [Rhodotorula araucariae]
LNDALLVPGISTSLISSAQLYDLHGVTSAFAKHATLARNNVVLANGSRIGRGLYRLDSELAYPSPSDAASCALAPRLLKSLAKSGDVTGLDIVARQALHGIAERVHCSVVEGLIPLLNQAGATKDLWPEAMQAFVFVKNRLLHVALLNKVPVATWRVRPSASTCSAPKWVLQQAAAPAFDLGISPGVVAADTPELHTPAPSAGARAVSPVPARLQCELLLRTLPPPHPHLERTAAPPLSPDLPDPINFLNDPFGATLAEAKAMLASTSNSFTAADDDFALPSSDRAIIARLKGR